MKKKKSAIILVFNTKKELLLQLRSSLDESYPNHWDFSAAGTIEKNEDPETAAQREMREELGIDATLQYVDTKIYSDAETEDECHFYKTLYDGEFAIDHQEVAEVRFFSLTKIKRMINKGEKFHPEFPYFWNKRFIQYLPK